MKKVSNGFQLFMEESNGIGQVFMNGVMKSAKVSALDAKIHELAYIAVLSALQVKDGLPYHVKHAKELGASLEEIKSAVLIGLPLVGIRLVESFAVSITSYEEE